MEKYKIDSLSPTPKEQWLDRLESVVGEMPEELWCALRAKMSIPELQQLRNMILDAVGEAEARGVRSMQQSTKAKSGKKG